MSKKITAKAVASRKNTTTPDVKAITSAKAQPAAKVKSAPAPKPQGAATTATPAATRPTKQSTCLALLRRTDGATLADLQTATGWLPHSVRGFLAGAVKKKLGLDLISSRTRGGPRRYRLAAGTSAQ